MAQTFTILPADQDPLDAHANAQPWKQAFITATGLVPMQEMPTRYLENASAEVLQKMGEVKAAGGILYPTDPDEQLAPEVHISLIRHADMVIDDIDEVVVPAPEATLRLNYPLSVAVLVPVKAAAPEGITRGEILHAVHDAYKTIYEREAASSPPAPIDDRTRTLNREATSGNFGIWGHDLSDLVLIRLDIRLIDGVYWIDPVTES